MIQPQDLRETGTSKPSGTSRCNVMQHRGSGNELLLVRKSKFLGIPPVFQTFTTNFTETPPIELRYRTTQDTDDTRTRNTALPPSEANLGAGAPATG